MREVCRRCLRPVAGCVCRLLPRIEARTRVVILQHPREARLAICSAWLCHAALPGSELIEGVRFDAHPRVAELLATPGTWLLFPGPGSVPARELLAPPTLTRAAPKEEERPGLPLPAGERAGSRGPPRVLLVIDSTWTQAVKLLRRNPKVAALPRLAITPGAAAESGYSGLRREPEAGHLATIDAVAEALGALEGDPARFAPMRAAFRAAVEWQLGFSQSERRRPRHRPAAAARYRDG